MAFYAKRLSYRASITSFVAVVALAKKKGGEPLCYFVYAYHVAEDPFVMRAFPSFEEAEENASRHWEIKEYEATTGWLWRVAVGGSFEITCPGTWTRVPTPSKKGWRKKKRPILIGDLGALHRLAKEEHELLKYELLVARDEITSLENNIEDGYLGEAHLLPDLKQSFEQLDAKVGVAWRRVMNYRCEMEYARSKSTGIPIPDHSCTKMVMLNFR